MTRTSLHTAIATVTGAVHRRTARNCQDAASLWVASPAELPTDVAVLVAAAVCDGCGGQPASEVGAKLGAQVVVSELARSLRANPQASGQTHWARALDHLLANLRALSSGFEGEARDAFVLQHLLFTLVACVVIDDRIAIFAIGDGLAIIDDEQIEFGPFANNAPPYLGYQLLDPTFCVASQTTVVERRFASFAAIATDGALGLPRGLPALLRSSAIHKPDQLRRQLELAARTTPTQSADLHDDTTVVWLGSVSC